MSVKEAKIIAEGMIKSTEKIAGAIIDNNTKNADALMVGFSTIGSSLSGTRAEIMLDLLMFEARNNGGEIPKPHSDKWKKCKGIAETLLKEFSYEKKKP